MKTNFCVVSDGSCDLPEQTFQVSNHPAGRRNPFLRHKAGTPQILKRHYRFADSLLQRLSLYTGQL